MAKKNRAADIGGRAAKHGGKSALWYHIYVEICETRVFYNDNEISRKQEQINAGRDGQRDAHEVELRVAHWRTVYCQYIHTGSKTRLVYFHWQYVSTN